MNEAKQYLKQYREALLEIRRIEDELQQMRILAAGLGSVNFVKVRNEKTGKVEMMVMDRVMSSATSDMSDRIVSLADVEGRLEERRSYALKLLMDIEEVIGKVGNVTERQLLHLRYIQMRRWEQIANELHLTVRWVYKLHGRGLEDVLEILNRE